MKTKGTPHAVASANIIADTEELTNLLHEDYLSARENPNIKFHVLQSLKDRYFLVRSIALKLHDLQYFGNEDLSHCKIIADSVKRCENAPEITKLHFSINLDPARKSIALKILENYVGEERNKQ